MTRCFFVSDLHGKVDRYQKLFDAVLQHQPHALFLGGDLLPHGFLSAQSQSNFVLDFLAVEFDRLQTKLADAYPRVFIIFGNDDARAEESAVLEVEARGLWEYIHNRQTRFGEFAIYGYACVPPTPFQLKDWERYDVSRFVDPGCISPEDGMRTVDVAAREMRYATIEKDLQRLTGDASLGSAVMLFHTPPYQTKLDRAALDGKMVDHTPLDVHVGSIAVRRFIEKRQPLLTLHGHIHESAKLTGDWQDRIGGTPMFSAAHHGQELALIRFDLEDLETADRRLV
jgi:Icc-related predicted phosphoesterase